MQETPMTNTLPKGGLGLAALDEQLLQPGV